MNKELLTKKVEFYIAGNESAFTDIYELTNKNLYVYARSLAKDQKLDISPDDLLQDTYMEIIKSMGSLTDPSAFTTWSKRIMYNVMLQKVRKTNKEVLLSETDDGDDHYDFFEQQEETESSFLPGEELDRREIGKIVMETIESLPPEQSMTVLAYYYEEMTIREIAEMMECSEGTVKSRLFKARETLRASLESYEKKHDIRLHGLLAFPFLSGLVQENAYAGMLPEAVKDGILAAAAEQAAGTAVSGAAGSAGTAGAVGSAGTAAVAGTAAKAGLGAVLKTFFGKAVMFILVASVSGGIVYMGAQFQKGDEPLPEERIELAADMEIALPSEDDGEEPLEDEAENGSETEEDWLMFLPDHTGYYCFEVIMNRKMEKEDLVVETYRRTIEPDNIEMYGKISTNDGPGRYLVFFTETGKLYEKSRYYMKLHWGNTDGVESVRLIEVDKSEFPLSEKLEDKSKAIDLQLGAELAPAMQAGGDNWYKFVPAAEGPYCFRSDFETEIDDWHFQMELYREKTADFYAVSKGVHSIGTEDGYLLYVTEDGLLEPGVTYYIRFVWNGDPMLKSLYFTQTDEPFKM